MDPSLDTYQVYKFEVDPPPGFANPCRQSHSEKPVFLSAKDETTDVPVTSSLGSKETRKQPWRDFLDTKEHSQSREEKPWVQYTKDKQKPLNFRG